MRTNAVRSGHYPLPMLDQNEPKKTKRQKEEEKEEKKNPAENLIRIIKKDASKTASRCVFRFGRLDTLYGGGSGRFSLSIILGRGGGAGAGAELFPSGSGTLAPPFVVAGDGEPAGPIGRGFLAGLA